MNEKKLMENRSRPLNKDLLPISAHALKEKFGLDSDLRPQLIGRIESLWRKVREQASIKAEVDRWTNIMETLYGHKPDLFLFIAHTYLVILAKIVVYFKLNNNRPDKKELGSVVSGKYFLLASRT